MRAADNGSSTFRPDAKLTRVTFKGNVVLTDVVVGGPLKSQTCAQSKIYC